MKKNLNGKIATIIGILLIFLYGIFGLPHGVTGSALKDAIGQRIHLGLDLSGGAHLVLQVQVKDAVNAETDNLVARIQSDLQTAKLAGTPMKPDPDHNPQVIRVTGVDVNHSGEVRDELSNRFGSEYDISGGGSSGFFTLTMKPTVRTALETKTVDQTIDTITDRVNSLGVSEPTIQKYGLGENQILVELPGVEDPERVRDIIKSTSRLEVHSVEGNPAGYASEQEALTSLGGAVPPDEILLHGDSQGATNDGDHVFLLKRVSIVGGNDFRDASPIGSNDTGKQGVNFVLTNAGGERFYDYTSANVGKYMAIVLGDRVKNVAIIHSAIRDQGQIEGQFSKEQIEALSFTLRTGALPANINYIEERTVGPSLGADSVKQGVTAAIAGMLAVMVFMLIYYRGSGINADCGAIPESGDPVGIHGLQSRDTNLAGHRRRHPEPSVWALTPMC